MFKRMRPDGSEFGEGISNKAPVSIEAEAIETAVAAAVPAEGAICVKCGRFPFEQCPLWHNCPQGRAVRPPELGEPIPRTAWIPGSDRQPSRS